MVPGRDRQRQRLEPEYRRLRDALDRPDGALRLRADPLGIAPERAVVVEIAGSLVDFHKAVLRVPGLEFLLDDEIAFASDHDFVSVNARGEPVADRPVPGRRYIAMPTLAALSELIGLYERWDREEALPREFTPWRDVFTQLKTLRAWGPEDRIADDAIAAWEEDLSVAPPETLAIEAELWFHQGERQRNDAIVELKAAAEALGGTLVSQSLIEPIAYHAALLNLPIQGLRKIMARDTVALVLADQVMFLRPQAVIRAAAAEPLPPDGRQVERPAAALAGRPIAALLDGFPLQRHALLDGRLTLDDADDLEGRATVNLGLNRMADAIRGVTYRQLALVHDWHIREETYRAALARLIDAHRALPLAAVWGAGRTSSSDGQYFRAGGTGAALADVNARHGNEPGVSFYTHISDQFGPFYTKVIAANTSEAAHVLDGLLYHDTGLAIEEHYTDTGGVSDHVFGLCHLFGFRFAPRMRDIKERRLYLLPD